MTKKVSPGALPHQVGKGLRDKQSGDHGVQEPKLGTWATVVKAAQGNFDHLMGVLRDMVTSHNLLVDDVESLRDYTEDGLLETATGQHTHTDLTEGHDGGQITAAGIDHGGLTGLADDDHPQYLTPAEHTTVGDASPHHAAVTIGADAEHSLAGQVLSGADASTTQKGHAKVGAVTPSTQAFGDAAAVGAGDGSANSLHKHAMPADPVTAHEAAGDPHTGYLKESDMSVVNATDLTDGGATTLHTHAGGSGHVIQDEGGAGLTARTNLNFVGAGVAATDDAGNDQTDITISEPSADAHISDTSDAHDASAISIADAGLYFTGTDVEAALQELGAGTGGQLVIVWSSKVSIVAGSVSRRIYVPFGATVTDIYFSLPEANTGTTRVDVHKNGTTLFTTQGNRPACTTAFVSDHKVPDVTALVQDNYLECYIDSVGGATGRVQVYIVATAT